MRVCCKNQWKIKQTSSESETSCLDFSYSSSKFEDQLDSADFLNESGIMLYLYEPEECSKASNDGSGSSEEEYKNKWLSNLNW